MTKNIFKKLHFRKLKLSLVFALTLATISFGSVSALAASPEASYPDNTVKLTVVNYKFNFDKYFEDTKAGRNTNPFDRYDPAGGSRFSYVEPNFTCENGKSLGGVPVLGIFNNTVNNTNFKARGDLASAPDINYCLNSSIDDIFQARAPKNNVNLIPQIFNITNTTSFYSPSLFDNGLCDRKADGSIVMKSEYEQFYNNPNQAIRDSFRGKLGNRNCNPGTERREIYQFRYTIEYPSNALCNKYYNTATNGQESFGTGTGQVDCPTYYRDAFGSKFGITSNKGIVATATYHLMLNESSNGYVGWRNVENGFRESSTDPVIKSWDGVAAFSLI
jgi:hypothetical protein